MARKERIPYTLQMWSTAAEALKVHYRPIIRAVHSALQGLPGGAADAFRVMDLNPVLTLNQFNPDDYEHQPSLLNFLAVLEYLDSRGRPVAHEIANLSGCVAVQSRLNADLPASLIDAAKLIKSCADDVRGLLGKAGDGQLRTSDKSACLIALQQLIGAAYATQLRLTDGAPSHSSPHPHRGESKSPDAGDPMSSVAQGCIEARGLGR